MRITDGQGRYQPVNVGLVDSKGCFLLLLDDDETRHYNFSDESELVNALIKQDDDLRKTNARLRKSLKAKESSYDSLLKDVKNQADVIKKLRKALDDREG